MIQKSRRSLLAIPLLTFVWLSFAQQFQSSGFNGSTAGAAVMSEEFRVNAPSEKNQETVEFFHVKYKTSTLDLRLINQYTKYTIPESVVVIPPDLSRFDHTTVLIGLYGDPDNPKMVIWLAGDYNYNTATFFLDYDQDRDFTNDKGSMRLKAGEDPVSITLTPEWGDQNFWLSVPEAKVVTHKEKKRIYNKIAIGVHTGAGSGNLQYSDINPSTYSDYYVNISEKHVGLNISYYSRYFIAGINASFQNDHFYASYDPDPNSATSRSPTSINPNRDLHKPNKVQLGLKSAIRIPLSATIEFQPTANFGIVNYMKPEYKKNKATDEVFILNPSNFIEIGARVEFTVGIENAFFVEFSKNFQDWKPEVMSDSDTFKSRMRITKFAVGYKVSLF